MTSTINVGLTAIVYTYNRHITEQCIEVCINWGVLVVRIRQALLHPVFCSSQSLGVPRWVGREPKLHRDTTCLRRQENHLLEHPVL